MDGKGKKNVKREKGVKKGGGEGGGGAGGGGGGAFGPRAATLT